MAASALWWAAALLLHARSAAIAESSGISWRQSSLGGLPLPYELVLEGVELRRGEEIVEMERVVVGLRFFGLRFAATEGIHWRGNALARLEGVTDFSLANIGVSLSGGELRMPLLPELEFATACLALGKASSSVADCLPKKFGEAKKPLRFMATGITSGRTPLLSSVGGQWHEDPPISMDDDCPLGACMPFLLVGQSEASCEKVKEWSRDGGVLELDRLVLTDGDGETLAALGTFALDSQDQPLAALEIHAEQLGMLLDLHRILKKDDSKQLNKAAFIFTFLNNYQDGDKPLSVTLQNGRIAIAGAELGRAKLPKIC